jgi:predicted nucleotidyltransferase
VYNANMVTTTSDALEVINANRNDFNKLGVVKIGLFGSFSRGDQNRESDIDLLVEFGKGRKNFRSYMQFIKLAESLLGREVEAVTSESLSPYIASYVEKEVKYVKTA